MLVFLMSVGMLIFFIPFAYFAFSDFHIAIILQIWYYTIIIFEKGGRFYGTIL